MTTHLVMFTISVRIIGESGFFIAAFATFAVLAFFTALAPLAPFLVSAAFTALAFVLILHVVKSSIQSFNRLLELCSESFRFVWSRFSRFIRYIYSDFRVKLSSRYLLELGAFCINEHFPFVSRCFICHESIEKLQVDDGVLKIRCVDRLVIIDVIDKLFKPIDVIIH